MSTKMLFIGTSGYDYDHWQGGFYPRDLPHDERFAYYAENFGRVEINNTYYNLPERSTFRAWRRQAPDGIVYAVKTSRYLTHMKRLKDPKEPWKNFWGGVYVYYNNDQNTCAVRDAEALRELIND